MNYKLDKMHKDRIARELNTHRNKLIAEFMGAQDCLNNIYDFGLAKGLDEVIDGECRQIDAEWMGFHESWDWLMPVVEKINDLTVENTGGIGDGFLYEMTISPARCRVIDYKDLKVIVQNEHGATLVEMVYLTVVEFIKWYNDNK